MLPLMGTASNGDETVFSFDNGGVENCTAGFFAFGLPSSASNDVSESSPYRFKSFKMLLERSSLVIVAMLPSANLSIISANFLWPEKMLDRFITM